jgi:hypothetical protein
MAFVPMRDQSLEYVLMTSNALIRPWKGNRGDKGPGRFSAEHRKPPRGLDGKVGAVVRFDGRTWPPRVRVRRPNKARAPGAQEVFTMSDRGKWLIVGLVVGLYLAIGVGLAIRAL